MPYSYRMTSRVLYSAQYHRQHYTACYIDILVFGTLWQSAVEINFVENGPITMCRTILSH